MRLPLQLGQTPRELWFMTLGCRFSAGGKCLYLDWTQRRVSAVLRFLISLSKKCDIECPSPQWTLNQRNTSSLVPVVPCMRTILALNEQKHPSVYLFSPYSTIRGQFGALDFITWVCISRWSLILVINFKKLTREDELRGIKGRKGLGKTRAATLKLCYRWENQVHFNQ